MFEKLKIKCKDDNNSSAGRGVGAKRDINAGEHIVFVPKKLIVTLEMAVKSPIGIKMVDLELQDKLKEPTHCFIAFYVLNERKINKDWNVNPYLAVWPDKFNNFPVMFTEEELTWLEGCSLLTTIRDKKETAKSDYRMACELLPELAASTLDEFIKMRLLISSRLQGFSINGQKNMGFVPFADMFNHDRQAMVEWEYNDKQEGFCVKALGDIPAGHNIYSSYVAKDSTRWFMEYGFLNPQKDWNRVSQSFELQMGLPHYHLKLSLLTDKSYASQVFSCQQDWNEPKMRGLLSWARYITFEGEPAFLNQTRNECTGQVFNGTTTGYHDKENERAAWNLIRTKAEADLTKYPTSLAEDEELLGNEEQLNKMSQNQRNCVQFRRNEKEILRFLINSATEIIRVTQLDELTLANKTRESIKQELSVQKYFKKIESYYKDTIYRHMLPPETIPDEFTGVGHQIYDDPANAYLE